MKSKLLRTSLIAATLFMAGCQTEDSGEEKASNDVETTSEVSKEEKSNEDSFPVLIESEDKTIEIKEKPQNILPLSLDVAEIVLELVDPSRVVAVSNGLDNTLLSTHSDIAGEIPNRISSATNIDPEEILSFNADLLLLTKMHGQEDDAAKVLSSTELPILTFSTMNTIDGYFENVELIGRAVGETKNASDLISQMTQKIEDIQTKIPADAKSPSVLVLSEVGPGTGPFMLGPGNISYDIIQKAGASAAVDSIDLKGSTPASIEQVLKMDPDYIFLLDFVGNGEEAFVELSENPGWNSLQAIQDKNIQVLDVKYLMNPNAEIVEGLRIMVDAIYGLEE